VAKSGDEKLSALKNFRRGKGLCFKCGEKWGPQHKCPPTISLHAMEELWKCVTEGEELVFTSVEEDTNIDDELMAISVQALTGTKGSKTIRLRGHLQEEKYLCWLTLVALIAS
jgi:hypothetical protein